MRYAALVATLSLFAASATIAQDEPTLGELIGKGAVQVSKEDLTKLLPGSTHESRGRTGSYRTWVHNADGTLVGDMKGAFSSQSPRGAGKWSVNDAGQYCVDIQWGRSGEEKWCLTTFKLGSDYYGARNTKATDAKPFRFTLSK